MTYDLIIIGAGVTGLYLAYRLRQETQQKILILEANHQVGGRINSAPLSAEDKYYAEGCATRFFLPRDYLLASLLKELAIGYQTLPAFQTQTPESYLKILARTQTVFPANQGPKLAPIAWPTAVAKANPQLNSVEVFAETSGYPLFQFPLNLDMAYLLLLRQEGDQHLVNYGFEYLCRVLYQEIGQASHITTRFQTKVLSIKKDKTYQLVTDHQTYQANKVVFTGTVDQLAKLQLAEPLHQLSQSLNQAYFLYQGLRLYLELAEPWWRPDQVFFRYNSRPLNQVIYYSDKVLLIYSNMTDAQTLANLLPGNQLSPSSQELEPMVWFKPDLAKSALKYLRRTLPQLIPSANLKSVTRLCYQYTENASQFMKPVSPTTYQALLQPRVGNFALVGGDYTREPGWVESCLESVEAYLQDSTLKC